MLAQPRKLPAIRTHSRANIQSQRRRGKIPLHETHVVWFQNHIFPDFKCSSRPEQVPVGTCNEAPRISENNPVMGEEENFEVSEVLRFEDTGISAWLRDGCKEMGIKRPTKIQLNCIPNILDGQDVIGCSKTGTGKTLAFAIPIIQKLSEDPFGIFALVLTPTRELAFQIADQFRILGKPIGLRDSIVVGGRDMCEQSKELHRKPHIVIATPGRLADFILSLEGFSLLSKIRFLVLDEADRLLDGQFGQQLKTIFQSLPKKRQTLLFSATITDALSRLQLVSVKKPFVFVDKTDDVATVEGLEQRYVLCPVDVKDAYLVYAIKNYHEKNPDSSILIFSQTCRECQAIAGMFKELKFEVGSLHSLIPQRERTAALTKFRGSRLKILICTDVAARGLDIPQVDLIVNHNVPAVPKEYIHRVGRAARAGRSGSAMTFVTQYDVGLLKAIEAEIGKDLDELKVSDKKVSIYVTQVLVARRQAEIKLDEQNFGERREINKRKQMIMEGVDPDEVDRLINEQKQKRKNSSRKKIEKLESQTISRPGESSRKKRRKTLVSND